MLQSSSMLMLTTPRLRYHFGSSSLFTLSQFCGLIHTSYFFLDVVHFLSLGSDIIEAIKIIKNQATLEMIYLKPTEEES